MNNKKQQDYFNLAFITISKVPAIYGISRATVYRWIESGQLPEPTRLTSKTVGWNRVLLDEVFLGKGAVS